MRFASRRGGSTTHMNIGTDFITGNAVHISDRRRHAYLIGQTGTGKSSLLLEMMVQDILNGEGFALLDPHGDLAEAVLKHIPTNRSHQLRYLNPADTERPVGWNPFSDVENPSRAADEIVGAFKSAYSESWGPRLEHFLINAVRLALDLPKSDLLTVHKLFTDDRFRMKVADRSSDPLIRSFWKNEYPSYDKRFLTEAKSPILNKLGRVLSSPDIRNILCQRSTIDLRMTMDEGRILICNLSKGSLGEGNAHLLGALLVSGIAQAAMSRKDIPEADRRPFHLYVDEFQNFATESFGTILSEARKYALTLTLAHQFGGQLSDRLRGAVMGNAGSVIALRLGAEDAPLLASHIGLARPDPLKDLPNFHAYARLINRDVPTSPIHLVLPSPTEPTDDRSAQLIRNSRTRFGRDRATVEAGISATNNLTRI